MELTPAVENEYGYTDWQSEEDEGVTDARPGVYWITITDPDGEEVAVIIHRTVDGQFPLDGDVAKGKEANAQRIVAALNRKYRRTEVGTLRSMLATAKSDQAANIARLREYREDFKVDPWEDTAAQIKRTEARIESGALRIAALEYAVAALG